MKACSRFFNRPPESRDFWGAVFRVRFRIEVFTGIPRGPERRRANSSAWLNPLSRRRERGFNQAEELARRLSGPLGIPVNTSILKRTRKTAPQKSLDSGGRLKNLEQAFTASVLPSGIKNIILVDDIYTTGSTIEACTRALRKAGAEHVYFVTIFIGHGQ